jgi:nucleoside-diphosphate-sugar epimerase
MVVPRYLVTGATGFLGAEIVKQLIGRGQQVVALVRSPEKASLLKALGACIITGDITDRDSLREPMTGVDGVFHTAAWYKVGVRHAGDIAERTNVDGTRNVIDVARQLAIPRVVHTSTVGVFGDTRGRVVNETYYAEGPFLTEYDRSKWKAHYEVAIPAIKSGAPVVIVMPGLIYGPGDTSQVRDALVQLLRGRLHITPSGATFAWGYVEDIARGLRLAMETGAIGESYLLTGPIHTFRQAMDMAARIAHKRAPKIHPPPLLMKMAAGVAGFVERWDFQLSVPAETLRLMAGTTWIGSSAKAQHALGFSTRSLNDGLRHTIEHELRQLGMA